MTAAPPAAPKASGSPTRAQIIAWVLVMVASFSLVWRDRANFQMGAQWDDADYIVLAHSLLAGEGYGLLNDPTGPARANYPFVLPLFLAPLVALFPRDFEVLKLVPLTATLANLALLFWGWGTLGRGLSHWWGLGAAALYGLSPLVVRHAGIVMSEPLFLTGCLAATWLVERVATGRVGRNWPVAFGALVLAVGFTRTLGVLPLAALVGYLLYRRGRAALPGLAVAALTTGALAVLVVALTPLRWPDLWPANYLQQNAALVSGEGRVTNQTEPYAQMLVRLSDRHLRVDVRNIVLAVGGGERTAVLMARLGVPWLPTALGYLLSALIALGWVRLLRRPGLSAFLAVALVYYGGLQLVLWITIRFLYPIQPQLYLGLLFGVDGVLRLLARWLRRPAWAARLGGAAAALTCAVLALTATRQSLLLDDTRLHAGDLEARTRWLRDNAAPDALVMSELPRVDYLYSGLQTVNLAGYSGEAGLWSAITEQGVDYIVSGPGVLWTNGSVPSLGEEWQVLAPIVAALMRAGRLTVAFESPADVIVVYRVVAP